MQPKTEERRPVIPLIFLVFSLLIAGATAQDFPRSTGESVYVPVYSHIYTGNKEKPFLLAVTLSIRNTDPKHRIRVTTVEYFDSKGKPLRSYLETTNILGPFSATRYVVKESDAAGGSGAAFLVRWEADQPVSPPIIETVMIGTRHQQGISFVSRAQTIPD